MSAPMLPGNALIKLRIGEAPQSLPTMHDIRRGHADAARAFGVGMIDRVISHFDDRARIAMVHEPADRRLRGFDALEHVTGLARTYRVRSEAAGDIVDALRDVSVVETTSPMYLAATPMATATTPDAAPAVQADRTWEALYAIRAHAAMAYEPGDPSVVLGLVDTGVLPTHPELPLVMRTGVDTVSLGGGTLTGGLELLGDESGYDTEPDDEVGHGTACAVLMSGIGALLPPGIAGLCTLLPARALGAAHRTGRVDRIGVGAIADIDDALKRVVDLGAKVINCSFGTSLTALDPAAPIPHHDIVAYAAARGCVLVAASGNSGRSEGYTPAILDGVIAVGAMGTDGLPARFSTSGDHVALAAPGERLATAALSGYGSMSGTSFASPLVAATGALLVSRAARRAVAIDVQEVAAILKATARPWPGSVPAGHGTGVLDALAALRALDHLIDRSTEQSSTAASPEGGTA